MNRKLIFLNLILLTSAVALGWRLRVRWLETQAHERAIFEKAAQAKAVLPPPPAPRMQSVKPADYLEVAQKMLFSKDRNPTVVIEPPPPKPEPPMPALPSYHGQMGIGEPVVILSFGSKPVQKRYHAGEQVGDFTLVGFDNQKITLDWKGKAVERKLEELAPKEPTPQQPAAAPPPTPSPAAVSLSPAGGALDKKNPELGVDMGAGFRACATGDTSPAGTVIGGYKKVITQGMFGPSCHWEQVK